MIFLAGNVESDERKGGEITPFLALLVKD